MENAPHVNFSGEVPFLSNLFFFLLSNIFELISSCFVDRHSFYFTVLFVLNTPSHKYNPGYGPIYKHRFLHFAKFPYYWGFLLLHFKSSPPPFLLGAQKKRADGGGVLEQTKR